MNPKPKRGETWAHRTAGNITVISPKLGMDAAGMPVLLTKSGLLCPLVQRCDGSWHPARTRLE